MVNSKKLLSLFLAVVMVFSVLTVMASAYTVGPEVAGDINLKYTVEKVSTVPETAAGSAEYTADNIYAVSVWMQCDDPVYFLTAPFHFDKTKFSPIMLFDGEVTYPYGAGFGVDDYYSNMGEGALYAYAEGDYLNNTGMYKANGTTATTKALAKCIGLGNANSEGVGITAELVSPDHPLYNKWGAGLPDNVGVMYANLDVTSVTKSAYLNTISGIETSTDWNKMFTVYFETLEGVTAADVAGAEFGVYTDDCFTVDGDIDASGYGYFAGATTAKYGTNPNKNVVENAVVVAAADPTITQEFTMARMDNWNNYNKATKFDAGIVCQLNDKALTFDANGKCNEIKSIKFYLGDDIEKMEKPIGCYRIYGVDDTTYQFRLQITNVDKTSEAYATGDFSYKAVITFTDGTAAVEYTGTANFQTILTDGYTSYQNWLAQQ